MKDKLILFLEHIWREGGKVYLAYKPSPSDFDVPPAKRWPEHKEQITTFLLAASAKGNEVYFAPAIYDDKSTSKHTDNVIHSWVLWVDLDGNSEDALSLVANGTLPAPSCRVGTGRDGHEHWYWMLNDKLPTEEFESLNRRIAALVGADHCWNANRVLRPPFTRNHKDPKNSLPVDIIQMTGASYDPEDFSGLPEVADIKTQIMESAIDLENLPTMQEIFAKYKWDAQHLDLFNNPPDRVRGSHVRNRSLMRLAFFCAEVGMPDEAIFVVVEDLDRRLEKFVGRSDRNRRLAELVAKARAKFPFGESVAKEVKEDIQQVFTFNELLAAEFKIEWLVENLLPARTINSIQGPPNTGKSRFAMQMSEALAGGTKFLEWSIGRPIKTVFFSLEMDRYMLKHFAESMSGGTDLSKAVSDNFILIPLGEPLAIGTPAGMSFVDTILADYQPEIVVIDAMGSLTPETLNDEKAVKGIMGALQGIINKYGCTIIVLHHVRKPEKSKAAEAPDLNDMYGNQYISAYMSMVLTLWAPENRQDNVFLIESKTRGRPRGENKIMDGSRGFRFIMKEEMGNDDADDDMFGSLGNLLN